METDCHPGWNLMCKLVDTCKVRKVPGTLACPGLRIRAKDDVTCGRPHHQRQPTWFEGDFGRPVDFPAIVPSPASAQTVHAPASANFEIIHPRTHEETPAHASNLNPPSPTPPRQPTPSVKMENERGDLVDLYVSPACKFCDRDPLSMRRKTERNKQT